MRLGNVMLRVFDQTVGCTPSEIHITCNNSDSAVVAARFSTLFHQMWMSKVVLLGKQVTFPSLHAEHEYVLMNVDPCSCILGYRSLIVKVASLAVQSLDRWAIACADDLISDVLSTVSHEYQIDFDGYVSYKWLSPDGETFTEFEVTSNIEPIGDKTYGWIGSLLGELVKHKSCYDCVRDQLVVANDADRNEFKAVIMAYRSWINPNAYNRLIALV